MTCNSSLWSGCHRSRSWIIPRREQLKEERRKKKEERKKEERRRKVETCVPINTSQRYLFVIVLRSSSSGRVVEREVERDHNNFCTNQNQRERETYRIKLHLASFMQAVWIISVRCLSKVGSAVGSNNSCPTPTLYTLGARKVRTYK